MASESGALAVQALSGGPPLPLAHCPAVFGGIALLSPRADRVMASDESGSLFVWKCRTPPAVAAGAAALNKEDGDAAADGECSRAAMTVTPSSQGGGGEGALFASASTARGAPHAEEAEAEASRCVARSLKMQRRVTRLHALAQPALPGPPGEALVPRRALAYSGACFGNVAWDSARGLVLYSVGRWLVAQSAQQGGQALLGVHASPIACVTICGGWVVTGAASAPPLAVGGGADERLASLRAWRVEVSDPPAASASVGLHQHDESGVACVAALQDGFCASLGCFDDLLEGASVIVWDGAFRLAAAAHLHHPTVALAALPPHHRRSSSAASAGGLRLAVASMDGVGLWTVAEGELRLAQRLPLTASFAAGVTALAFVADLGGLGPALALGCSDGGLRYWGFPSSTSGGTGGGTGGGVKGGLLPVSGRVGTEEVLCVDARARGGGATRVVATSADGSVAAWDVGAGGGTARAGMPLRLGGPCGSLALDHRGGDAALVGCADGTLYLAQLTSLEVESEAEAGDVHSGRNSSGGGGGCDVGGGASRASVAEEDRLLRLCGGHYGCPRAVRFVLGERLMASAGDDGTIRVFDARLQRQVLALATPRGACLGLASAGMVASGLAEVNAPSPSRGCGGSCAEEPGALVVAGCYASGHVRVFDLVRVAMLAKVSVFEGASATAVAFLAADLIVCGSGDGRLALVRFGGASPSVEPIDQGSSGPGAGLGLGVSSISVSAARPGTFCVVHAGWGGRVAVFDTALDASLGGGGGGGGGAPRLRCEVPAAGELLAACLPPWDGDGGLEPGGAPGSLADAVVIASGTAVAPHPAAALLQSGASDPLSPPSPSGQSPSGLQSRVDFVSLRSSRATASVVLDVGRVSCVAASTGGRGKGGLVAIGTHTGALVLLDRRGALVAQGSGHAGPVTAVEVGSAAGASVASACSGELLVWGLPE